jgi:hypothetical protein
VSDDSSTYRSVLGDVAKKKLTNRRVEYSQEITMPGPGSLRPSKAKSKRSDDSDDDSDVDRRPKKRPKCKSENEDEDEEDDKDVIIKDLKAKLETKSEKIETKNARIVQLKATIKDHLAVIEELHERNEDLERQKEEQQVGVVKNAAIVLLVAKQTKTLIWYRHKFIADNDELDGIMEAILLSTPATAKLVQGLDDDEKKVLLRSYSVTYGYQICRIINDKRSSVQTAVCDAVMLRRKEGGRIPTVGNMLQFIRRKNLDYSIEEGETEPSASNVAMVESNLEVFDWYSNKLVGKVVGYSSWGPNQKHFGHLSTYAPAGADQDVYVPANAEAFIQLLFENAEQKWLYMARCQTQRIKPNKKSIKMETKYSSSKKGHNKFGGWDQLGRNRFMELRGIIAA